MLLRHISESILAGVADTCMAKPGQGVSGKCVFPWKYQCHTKPGKGVGVAKCVFPWKYGNDETEYTGCANPSKSSVGLWCPTELDDEGKYISGKWGVCEDACQDDPTEYNGCANPNMSKEGLWCPTKLDDEGNYVTGHWGACTDSCPGNVLKV